MEKGTQANFLTKKMNKGKGKGILKELFFYRSGWQNQPAGSKLNKKIFPMTWRGRQWIPGTLLLPLCIALLGPPRSPLYGTGYDLNEQAVMMINTGDIILIGLREYQDDKVIF